MTPRVVIGATLYNHADDLNEALESLLIQSFLSECNARNNKAVAGIDPSAMRILK